jgi:hypothetical protein
VFSLNEHPSSPKFKRIKLEEIKENIKKILEINDRNNFYKRSYK